MRWDGSAWVALATPPERPGAPDAGPDAPPTRRRRWPRVAVPAIILAGAGSAFGALTVTGPKTDAAAAVADAVTSTLADRTARVNLELTATASGIPITASGSGSTDFTTNAMQLAATMDAGGQQVQMDLVYVGGMLYEQIPSLAPALGGKSWVSVDLSSSASSGLGSTGDLNIGQDPAVMLRLLAQQGNTVTPLGPSSVHGIAVQGYAVAVSADRLRSELAAANLPDWMRRAVSSVHFGSLHFDVYVDGKGLLRREAVATEVTAGSTALSLHERLDLSDYGVPVNVTPPPSDQVVSIQQLLQQAQTATTS